MATEQYAIGYDEGYQDGWNAALEPNPPSKQEQEPVAWKEINTSFCSTNKDLCDDDNPIPLYTAPPSNPWQSLTDEEIMKMMNYGQHGRIPEYVKNFVDAIETALRSKNNG